MVWYVWQRLFNECWLRNVGRGYVIHNSESVTHEGRYRAARAAKKLSWANVYV